MCVWRGGGHRGRVRTKIFAKEVYIKKIILILYVRYNFLLEEVRINPFHPFRSNDWGWVRVGIWGVRESVQR